MPGRVTCLALALYGRGKPRWHQLARYNRQNGVICAAMLRHMRQAIDTLRRCEPHRSYRPDGTEHNPPEEHNLGAA